MSTRPDIAEQLVLAEASAWLVRLQGSARDPAHEAAFRAWLAEDPAHARAFERVTDTWEIIPGAARQARQQQSPYAAPSQQQQRRQRYPRFFAVAAGLVVLVASVVVSLPGLRDTTYQTQVGEQQTVVLEDGTRVTLNTNTRLSVDYRPDLRRIRLDHGEAMFEVAKNKSRPFVVDAGREQVRALGTTFVVRSEHDRVDVLLLEGRVQVSGDAAASRGAPAAAPTVLEPGDRLTLRGDEATRSTLDRLSVEEATAWRRGEAMFDNATLAEAVAEINRYGKAQVHVDDPDAAALRISGVFATRDPVEFAAVIAKLHDLDVVQTRDGVSLKAVHTSH